MTIAAVPGLLAQGSGASGVVASGAGYGGLPKALVYSASKAALVNFTATLCRDNSKAADELYAKLPRVGAFIRFFERRLG